MQNFRGVARAGGGFNPFAAGAKMYGGASSPNSGAPDRLGYALRDRKLKARNNALLRLRQEQRGLR